MALLAVLFASGLGACGPMMFVVGMSPGDQRLTSTVVARDGRMSSDRVAIVDVSGIILNANKPGLLSEGENPVSMLSEKLAMAQGDPKVRAVILRINSPGGAVTASDIMHRQISQFRADTGKPVVALLMDVAASGGYYIACASDHIVAYPTSVTGSIGVIMQTISVKPALNRIGVQTDAITSGSNKEAGSFLSELKPEHRRILQGLVDDFYQRFVDVVRDARPGISDDDMKWITDGRVFSGQGAAEQGLVDELGDLDTAFAVARSLAGVERADLVLYHRPLKYVGSPYASAQQPVDARTQINLLQVNVSDLPSHASVGFYYLWQPE